MHKFEDYVLHPIVQAAIIVLLIVPVLTFAFQVYSQDTSLTELETKALVLNKQGKYSEAVKAAEEALKATEKKFGSDHPKTAASISMLGLLFFSHNEFSNAEPLYLQALKINENALGDDHPDVANDLEYLVLL